MRILITGGTGFIGSYLADRLASAGNEVHATHFGPGSGENPRRSRAVRVGKLDVTKEHAVHALLKELRPERIYHLAAQSYPALSWKQPLDTMQINVLGTVNVFEAVRRFAVDARVLVACSSAEYGDVPSDEIPVKEERPLLPLHPYGVSKVAQDLLAYQYWRNFRIHAVRARIFNTTGPGKAGDAAADFVQRVVALEKRGSGTIVVGNLEARRDLTDVRDMARGLELLMERGTAGEVYNVCSGKAVRMRDVLDMILALAKARVVVEQDPALLRPSDEPIILGENSKIRRDTGYAPEIAIDKTVADMVEFERKRLG